MHSKLQDRITRGADTARRLLLLCPTLLSLSLFLCNSLCALPAFRGDQTLPALGVKLRGLANASPTPLPPPKTWNYTWRRGSTEGREERYAPLELWRATQHGAEWHDQSGNGLVIARVTTLPPHFDDEHVTRLLFEATLAEPQWRIDTANELQRRTWATAFCGCDLTPPEKLPAPSSLAEVILFRGHDKRTLLYLFKLKRRYIRSSDPPPSWYCAMIHITDGSTPAAVRRTCERDFLPYFLPLDRPASADGRHITAAGRQTTTREPDSATRLAARQSIANLPEWWSADAGPYILLSNLKSANGRALVRELQRILPPLERAYSSIVPPLATETSVNVVRIFATATEYRSYVGPDFAWTSGLWSGSHRELVILGEERNRSEIMRTIYHEGFHQYLFHATAMLPHAIWYNEGHACLFEGVRLGSGDRLTIEETARAAFLVANIEAVSAHIPKLLAMSAAEFYEGSDHRRTLNYATAWGLVYFLHKGAPATRLHAYRTICTDYLTALQESRCGLTATRTAFAEVNPEELQRDFANFWRRGRAAARRYNPL